MAPPAAALCQPLLAAPQKQRPWGVGARGSSSRGPDRSCTVAQGSRHGGPHASSRPLQCPPGHTRAAPGRPSHGVGMSRRGSLCVRAISTEGGRGPATAETAGAPSAAPSPGPGSGAAAAAPVGAPGEDAAAFSVDQQSVGSWGAFFGVLTVVMGLLYLLWLSPEGGLGDDYANFFKALTPNSEGQMALMLLLFAVVHSGGAALRSRAEEVVGPRVYRVIFAGISLPLAVSAVVFFINHRYDGTVLWQLRGVPGLHELVWSLSLVSFFFLYPSTFNLLEVAAVDTPRVHLWGTGIARITRHPQMVGQLLWCLAHMLWIGSSFTATTSLVLCLHHAFGVWHGEQRLAAKYGDQFKQIQETTSIVPFAAILEGRQKLPADYYKEFLRTPYVAVLAMTLGAYWVHPLMVQASFWLHW